MIIWYTFPSVFAPVAQLDRALASGAKGRAFDSRQAHQNFRNLLQIFTRVYDIFNMVYSSMLSGRAPVNTALPSSERLRLQAFLARNKHNALARQLNSQLKELDIDFPQRFKESWTKKEIIRNRQELANKNDSRPIALVIYPKVDEGEDGRQAFIANDIESLIEADYRVIYFEAGNQDQVVKYISDVGQFNKINLLVLGAHGEPSSMNFGAGTKRQSYKNADNLFLDIQDREELRSKKLQKYFYADSLVILESCSSGQGGKESENMVNVVHEALGIKVIGPEEDVYLGKYTVNEKRRVIGKEFICKEADAAGNQVKAKIYQIGKTQNQN